MFLNSTYFQGEINLPFLGIQTPDASGGVSKRLQTIANKDLDWFIGKYESQYLTMLLGNELYDSFMIGIQEEVVDQKWIDLRDRIFKSATVNGMAYGYSPAANYVYFYIMRDARTQTTMKGEVQAQSDYAIRREEDKKCVKAWNDMVVESLRIVEFIRKNWEVYKEDEHSGDFMWHNRHGWLEPINAIL